MRRTAQNSRRGRMYAPDAHQVAWPRGGRAPGLGGASFREAGRRAGLCQLGLSGTQAADVAKSYGIALEVVKLPEAQRSFVLLPRR